MTSNINGKARDLFSMIKKDKSGVNYMMEINISHLQIICRNDWRGECLSSPGQPVPMYGHQPRLSRGKETSYSYPFHFVEGKETLQRFQNAMTLTLWPNLES